MKRFSSSGASAFGMLITLAVIGISLYLGLQFMMSDTPAPEADGNVIKKADMPAAAAVEVQSLNEKQDEQMKAINDMIGKKTN